MTYLVQQLIQGLAIGSIYGLIAIGYVLIYNAWGVLNFAQGDMVMIGAFAILITHSFWGMPLWLAFPVAILFCCIVGFFIEITAFRPLISASNQRRLIATIGIGIFLRNLVRVIFGADPFPFNSIFGDAPFKVGSLTLVPQNLWNMAIGFGLVILLSVFLKNTRMGKAMRATAQDREAATLMGINVKRSMSTTFIMASALGGFAGMLIAPVYFVIATLGNTMGNKGFAAALLGGISSNAGSMTGGITLGILESLGAGFLSSAWQSAIAFLVLFLVLTFKPSGIMGKKETRKV
ncbi:MAG: branched-chain amino acid ABC transporter permease [Candidatus Pelethousia sp.]|nr:branched-chain amino acid ABC transporter permease [Candidatus Pelethousia sp.]